jgi:pimeloyl-ACP methyl ester carboxylesterase
MNARRPVSTCASRLRPLSAILLSVVMLSLSSRAVGQGTPSAPPASKNAASKAPKLPPAEDVDLLTDDGVALKATFYQGTKGKESVPVILLHMYKGSRKDYTQPAGKGATPVALYLQQQGHAVLVPDLRGHGDSTWVRGAGRRIDAKTMPVLAFGAMVSGDVEACKRFLLAKNNEGQLNIEKLCLVGAEMGGVVAMDYARFDWSWPLLAIKQGQDVKALVLISPQRSFRGLQIKSLLSQRAIVGQLSMMLLVGSEDKRAEQEARQLYTSLKRFHPNADAAKPADRTLFYLSLPTSLQGTKMFEAPELQVAERIAGFIKVRLVDQAFPWKKRKSMP